MSSSLFDVESPARPSSGFAHERGYMGETNIWLTPKSITNALGHFDLDPCAAPYPRPWDIADVHYDITQGQNGLALPWVGRVFCNPPYGPDTGKWMRKMGGHGNGIALIFARTETRAWQQDIFPFCYGVLFLAGRVTFHRPDGSVGTQATAPSALVAFSVDDAEVLRRCKLEGILVHIAGRV